MGLSGCTPFGKETTARSEFSASPPSRGGNTISLQHIRSLPIGCFKHYIITRSPWPAKLLAPYIWHHGNRADRPLRLFLSSLTLYFPRISRAETNSNQTQSFPTPSLMRMCFRSKSSQYLHSTLCGASRSHNKTHPNWFRFLLHFLSSHMQFKPHRRVALSPQQNPP